MAPIAVSHDTFEAEVLNAPEPVVVEFWAEWGGPPCRMIAAALEEISSELVGQVKIVKLNVNESPKIAVQYGLVNIPTLLLFKGGQVAARQVGAQQKSKLKADARICQCQSPSARAAEQRDGCPGNPDFAEIFGPESRAEVAIAADLGGPDGASHLISGRSTSPGDSDRRDPVRRLRSPRTTGYCRRLRSSIASKRGVCGQIDRLSTPRAPSCAD